MIGKQGSAHYKKYCSNAFQGRIQCLVCVEFLADLMACTRFFHADGLGISSPVL